MRAVLFLAAVLAAACLEDPDTALPYPDAGATVDSPSPYADPEVCALWDDPEGLDAWGRTNVPEGSCLLLRCEGPLGPCDGEVCALHVCHHAPDGGVDGATSALEAWVLP